MNLFRKHILWVVSFVLAAGLVTLYQVTIAAPSDFAPGATVHITSGMSAPQVAEILANADIIARPTLFRTFLRVTGQSENIHTGLYRFDTAQNLFTVAYRLAAGEYGIPPARITFIEGVTNREAAIQVAAALPGISADAFLAAAEGQEGYLFPDTYFFQPGIEADAVVASMRANFESKMNSLSGEYTSTQRTRADSVIMASIIEKEARTVEDKHLISGILWNRIDIGMPLQVDAVFGYIFNRSTYSPSPSDLKVNSPYNTYLHRGLPPGPIGNPGLDSLRAAIAPTKTSYLYYLTGNDGLMHYATTYTGHQANLRKYLK